MSGLKTIHRIYFGFDGKPDMYGDYLETWAKHLPQFQIKHWNAENLPMDACAYTTALYKERDGVFLTDYFRWWVVREYGGVYFDADIEVVDGNSFARIIEKLEQATDFDAVVGVDRLGQERCYTAHCFAARPHAALPIFMCDLYENLGKLYHQRKKKLMAPELIQLYFYDSGKSSSPFLAERVDSGPRVIENVKVYPAEYFSPLVFANPPYLHSISDKTCLCHHFGASWVVQEGPVVKAKRRHRTYADYKDSFVQDIKRNYLWKKKQRFYSIVERIFNGFRTEGELHTIREMYSRAFGGDRERAR